MKKQTLLFLLSFLQLAVNARQPTPEPSQNLYFIENRGQIKSKEGKPRRDIDFTLQTSTMNLFIGNGQLHYQFMKNIPGPAETLNEKAFRTFTTSKIVSSDKVSVSRLDVSLIGANKNALILQEDVQPTYYNYYGASEEAGITYVKTYNKITYKEIYPHIDWVLYTNGQSLKYDFVVRPGGRVADIKMKYEGANDIQLSKDGRLHIVTPSGSLLEQSPYSYELQSKMEVVSSFNLKNNIVSFTTAGHEGTLVIDPGVEWGTYLQGLGVSVKGGIQKGYFYGAGLTSAITNIATAGAFQDTFAGGASDATLAKYDTFGRLQWATYYGGSSDGTPRSPSGYEYSSGATADAYGHVYLCGTTYSKGLATKGSYQDTARFLTNKSSNGFLAQFNTDGVRQWATYYGFSCGFNAVACDPEGNVYVGGFSDSTGTAHIVTPGTHQTTIGGGNFSGVGADALLVKFDNSGKRLWATFYGGESLEHIFGLLCDSTDVHIYGLTYSKEGGIATPEAFQDSAHAGDMGFLAKFKGNNGQRIWGTFIDGIIFDMALNAKKHLYIIGNVDQFWDKRNIATPGTYMPERFGETFLMQFNPQNGLRNWGTFYGVKESGNSVSYASGSSVACDPYGDVYISGTTNAYATSNSKYTIATTGSHQDTLNSDDAFDPQTDAFVAQFDSTGRRKWATFYGGPEREAASGLTCDDFGSLYLSGGTASNTNIATKWGLNPQPEGSPNGFLVRFKPVDIALNGMVYPNRDTVCTGNIPLKVALSNRGKMDKTDSLKISYVYTGPANGDGLAFFVNGFKMGSTDTFTLDLNLTLPGVYDFVIYSHYTRDDSEKDNDTLSFRMVVIDANPIADIDVYHIGTTFHFRNTNPRAIDRYFWDFGDGQTSTAAEPTHEYALSKTYTVTLILSNICGSDTSKIVVEGRGTKIEQVSLDEQLSIYPNPTNDYLFLLRSNGVELEAYWIENILGQTLSSGALKGARSVDVSHLTPGSYFIKFRSSKGWISKPFQRIP